TDAEAALRAIDFDLTRLEEIDSAERRLGVREQPLQIVHRGRRTLAAGRLERPLLVAARERQLIQHEHHGVRQVERRIRGARGDGHHAVAAIQRLIGRSEEHTSELQSRFDLVCRLLLEKKKKKKKKQKNNK